MWQRRLLARYDQTARLKSSPQEPNGAKGEPCTARKGLGLPFSRHEQQFRSLFVAGRLAVYLQGSF